ncbi:hypothetical protein QR680_018754 [Steinernema hermaphroditum]|uniref:Uncharacterized protein n=1 Tax=Steinernema hermaphroditum TaxID=289476 RepID=A0AA39LRK3_9BILA|nr:hypothetical protein QR680_018754 [Steinernema hermaphroditum]
MKGLRIEGKAVGKRPPFKAGISRQGSGVSLTPSVVRRSGSAGNVARHVSASASGSPRHEPKHINGHAHHMEEREQPHKKESRGVCKCQELNAKARVLQEDYTNNLQQQIYYLELENSYLRQGQSQYWNPETKPRHQRDSYQRQSQASIRSHVSAHSHQSHQLHRTYSDESLPDWSHRPIIHHHDGDEKPAPSPSKHVDFRFHYNHPPKRHDSPTEKELDLLQKLEEASQREYRLEERLTKKSVEYQHVVEEKTRLEEKIGEVLKDLEDTAERNLSERRALMEENIDLQQRLDDLTPLIAQKESQIARLEGEVEQLSSKLRLSNSQIKSLQMRLDDSKREEALFSERDSDRQSEIDRLSLRVSDLTSELDKIRAKETHLIEEVSSLKRRLKEEELKYKKERSLNDKITEENNFLIKENSKWSSELTRMELTIDQQNQQLANRKALQATADEIAELKVIERTLRSEVSNLEERLRSEQERNELYESQLREREQHEDQSRESRNRMQKELEALQALSRSLNNENRGLREEKLALSEKVEILQKRLTEKEQELSQLSDSLEELRMKYRGVHDELEKQSVLQSEKSHELDVLIRKVKDLSSSIPSDSRPSTSMARSHSVHTTHSRQSRIPSVHIEHQSIPHRHDDSTSTRKSTGSRCSNGKTKIH